MENDLSSLRPYMIRAVYEWCADQALTPYLTVVVDENTCVPREYVDGDSIVLNISEQSTAGLQIKNDAIEFKARFSGQVREICVPIGRVAAIYARENGLGLTFSVIPGGENNAEQNAPEVTPPPSPAPQRSGLRRVK